MVSASVYSEAVSDIRLSFLPMIVAICSRVTVSSGENVVSLVPVTIPASAAAATYSAYHSSAGTSVNADSVLEDSISNNETAILVNSARVTLFSG